MTASQYASGRPAAAAGVTLWRTACRAARALRAVHDEQVLMWELSWQVDRVPDAAQASGGRADRRPVRP